MKVALHVLGNKEYVNLTLISTTTKYERTTVKIWAQGLTLSLPGSIKVQKYLFHALFYLNKVVDGEMK